MSLDLQIQIDRINALLNNLQAQEIPLFFDGTNVGIGTNGATIPQKFTVDGVVFFRQVGSTRYRNGFQVAGGSVIINAYDDTGATYIPMNIDSSILSLRNPTSSLLVNVTGTGAGASSSIEIGASGTGSRYAYIDLHGDDTYTDYSSRFIRENLGANSATRLQHRGTGTFGIDAVDAASIILTTAGVTRLTVNSSGVQAAGRITGGEHVLIVGNFYPGNQGTYYWGYDGSTSMITNGNVRSVGNFYGGNQATNYLGYSASFSGSTYTNVNFVAGGSLFPSNQGSFGISWSGNEMLIGGNINVGGAGVSVSGGAGIITAGNTLLNFLPTAANWSTGGSTLILTGSDYSSIAFHDSGSRVDFIVGGGGILRVGYDGGWGAAIVTIPGSARIGASGLYIGNTGIAASYLIHLSSDSAGKPVSSVWSVVSDSRSKNKVTARGNALSRVKQLQVKDFEFNGEFGTTKDAKGVGVVAEEMQLVYPNSVKEIDYHNEDGSTEKVLTVNYHEAFVDSLIAVQELTTQLDSQAQTIDKLEKAIEKLIAKSNVK